MTTKQRTHNHAPTADGAPVATVDTLTPDPPSPEAIAVRAYELYVARGCAEGCDVDDWLQAERELRGAGVST